MYATWEWTDRQIDEKDNCIEVIAISSLEAVCPKNAKYLHVEEESI